MIAREACALNSYVPLLIEGKYQYKPPWPFFAVCRPWYRACGRYPRNGERQCPRCGDSLSASRRPFRGRRFASDHIGVPKTSYALLKEIGAIGPSLKNVLLDRRDPVLRDLM
jgi:hypothetical protein